MFSSRQLAWCAWLVASFFYAYQYLLRVMPNILLNDIMQRFNIDAAVFGQFSGAYYIGYCLLHLPIGIMLDRYGPRKVMTSCILLAVAGLLPIIYADYWLYPILGRFFIGVGSSAAILGAFKIIRMSFDERHFTRMLSFSVTIGLLGAIYGGVPVSYLLESYGYKAVVQFLAFLGVIFALITYLLVPDTQEIHKTKVLHDLKLVLSNRKVLLVCILAGLMIGPMEGFADAWGSEFLKKTYGFDGKTSNYFTSMIYIGMCFAPILSRIAEKTGRFVDTIAGAGVVMLIIFTLLMSGLMESKSILAGFFLVGLCCAYQVLAIYQASTYVPEHVAGLTTAVANMIIMSFGYFFHSTIGFVTKYFMTQGDPGAVFYGVTVIPMAIFVAVIGFFGLAISERNLR